MPGKVCKILLLGFLIHSSQVKEVSTVGFVGIGVVEDCYGGMTRSFFFLVVAKFSKLTLKIAKNRNPKTKLEITQ